MIIETERLILRTFQISDAEDVFEYLKKPQVNCFACMKLNSLEEAIKVLEKRSKDKEFYFAIVLKETGKVIGEMALVGKSRLQRRFHRRRALFQQFFRPANAEAFQIAVRRNAL